MPFLDGRFRASQEIWFAVHEDPRCNTAALHTSFERTRREGSGRGYQQSTELSERQGLSGGARRAVPRPAPAVESVHVKINTGWLPAGAPVSSRE